MSEHYNDKIELAPPSPRLQRDAASQWMDWEAKASQALGGDAALHIQGLFSKGSISVPIDGVGSPTIRVRVKQEPAGNFTQLYLASLRALSRIEKHVGRLVSIEGVLRERWDVNFLTGKQFTLFEGDSERVTSAYSYDRLNWAAGGPGFWFRWHRQHSGCPVLRALCEGRESGMLARVGSITPRNPKTKSPFASSIYCELGFV